MASNGTDAGWGMLTPYESFGRAGDVKDDFINLTSEQALSEKYEKHTHASHTMIIARDDRILWDLYASKAAIMMQMRFDGLLGFPGGLVDPPEDPVTAANRELNEEMNFDLSRYSVKPENHIISFFNEKKGLVLHFYGIEVSLEDFKAMELNTLNAVDYGGETLGIVRPPIYTMGDGYRGLPAFLSNSFAGNARDEFLIGLKHFKILNDQEISEAFKAYETKAYNKPLDGQQNTS